MILIHKQTPLERRWNKRGLLFYRLRYLSVLLLVVSFFYSCQPSVLSEEPAADGKPRLPSIQGRTPRPEKIEKARAKIKRREKKKAEAAARHQRDQARALKIKQDLRKLQAQDDINKRRFGVVFFLGMGIGIGIGVILTRWRIQSRKSLE